MQRARTAIVAGLAFLASLFCFWASACGHALQPGYLEIRLVNEDLYGVVWKVPAVAGRPMAIDALLPECCEPRRAATSSWDGTAYVARWTARCAGGIEGAVIAIEGLEQTSTDVLVRFELANGVSEARRLTPDHTSFTVPREPSRLEVMRTYFSFGVEHILLGIDHLLFILALLLLVRGARRVVATITAFTLAHSLTLAGATLGWVHVPGPPVEAVIALSIVFVASEAIHAHRGNPGLTQRSPWVVAFTFGLLHGFGFAGALTQVGLPPRAIVVALLFFNVGVEIGQMIFVAALVLARAIIRRLIRMAFSDAVWQRLQPQARLSLAYVIGSISCFWLMQRIVAFW